MDIHKLIIKLYLYLLQLLIQSRILLFLCETYCLLPRRLGNRKRHRERANFELVFSRLTDKEFKRQTALSKKNFLSFVVKLR